MLRWAALGVAVLVAAGCARERPERVEWVIMNTVAAVQFRGERTAECRAAEEAVRERFGAVNAEFNLYDEGSAIRRLGRCTEFGRPCEECARELNVRSGGVFNPYWRRDGLADYGAIAKGFAVDAAAKAVGRAPCDMLVDLGGNLKSVRGEWRVGIEGSDEVITLREGMACATSGEYYRGKHIRDGRTGLAVTNGLVSVTVVHPGSAMLADGLSTTLFVLGREAGECFLRQNYPEATAYWIESTTAR